MMRAWMVATCALVAGAGSACRPEQDAHLAVELRDQIAAMNAELAGGDTAAIRPKLADDLTWLVGATGEPIGKTQILAAIRTPQNPRPRFDIDSVVARRIGSVALVDYRRTDHRRVGGYELPTAWRIFEVYVEHGGHWQLTRHVMTWIRLPPPVPERLDSATLSRFVGHYQIHPDYIDNVHFEGSDLVATATGQTDGAHLVPVSQAAFVPDGVGQLLVFERGPTGRVIGYIQGYPNGEVLHARRID